MLPATSFPGLPAPDHSHDAGPRRIAIASVDIAGPYHCGGVGAAYHGLALALAEAGHQVTVVYLHDAFHQGSLADWTAYFETRGIRFVHAPQAPRGVVWYGNRKEASLSCYHWLRDQPRFDVVHFPEWLGLPYYSLVAKKLGLAFAGTTLCVGTHGPLRWSRDSDESLASRPEDLVVDFMERKSVELADVVVSPSQYLLQWMRDDGWILPQRSYVAHNTPQPLDQPERSGATDDSSIRELVFFGRLDRRKGLLFFCDVLDRLSLSSQFSITFLGSEAVVDGRASVDFLRVRASSATSAWTSAFRTLTSLSRTQALEYLHGAGRLAVMPSQSDNSPCTVQECLDAGIPFLASDRGGIPELVHPDDRGRVTAPLQLPVFAARIEEILRSGQLPARPAPAVQLARDTWRRWHEAPPVPPAPLQTSGELPFISVCIAHFERPHLLERMLASLRVQTYSRMEVLVVDDGSTTVDTRSYLDALHDDFVARGWQLLRQANAGPGIARDRAARAARGSHLLFADDDDEFLPHTIETFARVAAHSGADALSCVLMEFEGDAPPASLSSAPRLVIPLGPALAAGLIYPEFGGTAYLLTRECYFAVGGFRSERDVDEDWELLLNVVAHGFDLRVIPENLVWYRKQAGSRSRADNRFARNLSRVKIYEKLLPLELRDLASIAFVRLSHVTDSGAQKRMERVVATLEKSIRRRDAAR
jgi:glycosyltransferase involved in cell wall biosynthesis